MAPATTTVVKHTPEDTLATTVTVPASVMALLMSTGLAATLTMQRASTSGPGHGCSHEPNQYPRSCPHLRAAQPPLAPRTGDLQSVDAAHPSTADDVSDHALPGQHRSSRRSPRCQPLHGDAARQGQPPAASPGLAGAVARDGARCAVAYPSPGGRRTRGTVEGSSAAAGWCPRGVVAPGQFSQARALRDGCTGRCGQWPPMNPKPKLLAKRIHY